MAKDFRISLQDRDERILAQIAESPACSRTHIALSFFGGSYDAAKKRIQQLAREGLIQNNDETALGRTILRLTEEGVQFLEAQGVPVRQDVVNPVSRRLQKHEAMLADCQVAFRTAIEREYDAEVEFYEPERIVFEVSCSEHRSMEIVHPDGFSIVRNFSWAVPRHYFFFEIDCSTETQGHLSHLAAQYQAYRDSGDFAAKFGNAYEPKRTSFRVLLIVKSKERLRSTAQSLRRKARTGTLVWISTYADFVSNPSGSVWHCPLDFGSSDSLSPRLLFEPEAIRVFP